MQPSISSENQEPLIQDAREDISKNSTRASNYRSLLVAVKILAGLALLVLAVRGIQFESLVAAIRSADLGWLVSSVLMVLLGLGLKLWRWRILTRNYQIQAGFPRLFSAYFVGQAANILLPLRGGELIRLGYFGGEKQLLPAATTTVVIEKYLDLLTLTLCCIIVSLNISLDNVLNLRGLLLPTTLVVSALLLIAVALGPSLWQKARKQAWLPRRLVPWLDRWVQASLWLRKPRQVLPALALTILVWLVMWATNLFLFKSLGLPLGASAGGLVLVLVYIGLLPALMPGNIGPFYFFASVALLPFAIAHGQAVAYAVLLHAIVTLPPLLAGAIGLLIRSKPPTLV